MAVTSLSKLFYNPWQVFGMVNRSILKVFRLFHPLFLLGGALLFALGSGIAHYLGHSIQWSAYLLGQVCVTFLQLSLILLKNYFDSLKGNPAQQVDARQVSLGIMMDAEGEYHLSSQASLLLAATALTSGAIFVAMLLRNGFLNPEIATLLVIAFLLVLFYAAPPLQLANTGYGELAVSLLLANLVPALSFLLQTGSLHRLLAMTTFPLTPLYLAMSLALALPDYLGDLKNDRRTLLIRLGWQRGMTLHNILVLVGFLLVGFSITAGLPWRIAWPALLPLPVGLFQIWQMNQIAEGVKPRWRLLAITAMATFCLTAYMLAFSFWTG
jgi:1,4-dihydroxy-2-naphthoate octaprenyltransferase